MKRFALAITLSCVLAGSALAGEMPMVGPAPAPTPTTVEPTPTVPGDIPMTALSALLSVFDWLSA